MKLFAAVAIILCAGTAAFADDPVISSVASPDVKKITFPNNKNVEVYAIRDKDTTMKASLFSDCTKSSSLKNEKLKNEYPASINCFVLRYKLKNFLIDAGNYDPKCGLLTKLASVNIRPKAIDYILITHLHSDHIGGLINEKGEAVFPNAKVYLSYEEWRTIPKKKNTDAKESQSEKILRQFCEAYNGRIKTLNFGEPVEGVFAVKAVGHTPGHCFYRQGKLLFIGDAVHAVDLQIPHPEFCASFDKDPKQAYNTRNALLESMREDSCTVFGAHIPFPGVGTILGIEDSSTEKDAPKKYKYIFRPGNPDSAN